MESLDSDKFLLSQSPRSEHFSNKVDVPISSIDPGSVKLHYVLMLQRFKEMNLAVEPFKIFRTLQEIIELDLVPSNFNPLILIKCSISARINQLTITKSSQKDHKDSNFGKNKTRASIKLEQKN